jgi:hypothetical protein
MVEYSTKELPAGNLSQAAKRDQDPANILGLSLQIENKTFTKEELLRKYRTHTKEFQVTLPKKVVMGVTESGPPSVIADGYDVIIKPLPKAEHIIKASGNLIDPDWLTKVTTNLIVE